MTVTTGRAGYFATEGGLGVVVAYGLIFAALLKFGGVPVRGVPDKISLPPITE